jgi:hypothetical protein
MEAALISAAIAAIVSILGVLANIRIARATRQSVVDRERVAAAIAETRDSIAHLRTYTADIERLRIAVSMVMMSLGPHPMLPDQLDKHTIALEDQFHEFFRSWAEVKSEVPSLHIEYVRMCRHDCRNAVDAFIDVLRDYRASDDCEAQAREYRNLQEAFMRFCYKEDQLHAVVTSIRNEKLEQFILDGEGSKRMTDPKFYSGSGFGM